MAFFGRSDSNTHEVKPAKVGKPSRGPKMSRKERKAAAKAAATASAMRDAASESYQAEPNFTSNHQHSAAEPRMSDLTVGDYANGMPRIRLGEFFKSFANQLKWVVPLLIVGTIASWVLTKDFKRTYSGEGRILVQLGDEYVFESVTSGQPQGMQLTPDHIVLNETGIMKNADIIEQVVGEMVSMPGIGEKRFAEEAFKKINSSTGVDRVNAQVELAKQLDENEAKIANFLRKNGVSDFDSERGGVTKRTEELRTQLNTLRSDMTETERALATVEQQLRGLPEQIDLYVDDRASQRIAQAELELKQLLAKYVPGSPPVRQKQSEINELKSLLAGNAGRAAGGRRVGPNPVYQSTLQNRNGLQSRADSLREKEYVLQRQLDAADAKVRRLQDISPTYASLLRDRETLNQRLKSYTAKEQEALVNQEQAESSSENVRVISPDYAYSIPESVPVPAAAFAAAPYEAGGYDANQQGYAAATQTNPYGAQPYNAEHNYEAPYVDPYAPQTAQASYGNAAQDIYANPYAQGAMPSADTPQAEMDVLGTVPTENA